MTTPVPFDKTAWRAEIAARVDTLVAQMTLPEKVAQMAYTAPAIPRLNIPAYNWWNECLHGIGRAGKATVFPQSIGMAATFDTTLMHTVATAIADEGRAKHHDALRRNSRLQYQGLTYWSPNINIFRDPRWGRGQETYGEDPCLTGRMGVAFCRGLQGDDPRWFKLVATPKHYAVHSGPEPLRHGFDARVSPRDLRETYLPAFKACAQEAGAFSVMGAYNRTNGEACCASKTLLQDILRDEWGFEGYVVSDCGAITDIHAHHKLVQSIFEAAALSVRHGCDLNCDSAFASLGVALQAGHITEKEIDTAVKRLFTARFLLGMFDSEDVVPYAKIPASVVNCARHRQLARRAAQKSIVLLKNAGAALPLAKDLKSIAVVGPVMSSLSVLWGNYAGIAPQMVTLLEGITGKVSAGTKVTYVRGCDVSSSKPLDPSPVKWNCDDAEVIIATLGYTPEMEGEEGDAAEAAAGGDRVNIGLSRCQEELLAFLVTLGKPVVLVLTGGSPIALTGAAESCAAIVMCWYPGEQGGHAVADVLFGDVNPAGRLPLTFVKSVDQLPPFADYSMKGRTYRFMDQEPLYRFGHGLSYTTFAYGDLKLSRSRIRAGKPVKVSVTVTNTGCREGDEVAQLYVSDLQASVPVPRLHLEGFTRVHLQPGQSRKLTFTLQPAQLSAYDDAGKPFVEPGEFRLSVGGGQPGDGVPGASAVLTVI